MKLPTYPSNEIIKELFTYKTRSIKSLNSMSITRKACCACHRLLIKICRRHIPRANSLSVSIFIENFKKLISLKKKKPLLSWQTKLMKWFKQEERQIRCRLFSQNCAHSSTSCWDSGHQLADGWRHAVSQSVTSDWMDARPAAGVKLSICRPFWYHDWLNTIITNV